MRCKYSCQHRYNIHPQKSTLIKTERTKTNHQHHTISLGESPKQQEQQTTHLGIIRAAKYETKLNIQEHISVARRTLYTLIAVGLNGQEGLNPRTAYKIYQAYVIPRLLYGLEILPLNSTQMTELKQFHLKTLRCFQSLPIRTATAAVYMLLGALPIEAEMHKRQLSLLYSILASENTKLENLIERQMTVNAGNSDSFFSRIQEILKYYNLPTVSEFKDQLPSKMQKKKDINRTIANKWSTILQEEMKEKSTLKRCNTQMLKIHETHPVWKTLPPLTYEVKKANIKARPLTGTYLLQEHFQRFTGNT
ncbi:unnamed protein product [Mytilus coruscus]|uniref:Uncharacterized protein n=1 Tax=Mytilus coruscus TaxID=42192 RepID=A0A6J8BP22_MYTCO|nr:unnamed protein product [Mytilus coruscus]